MELQDLIELGTSNQIVASDSVVALTNALQSIVKDEAGAVFTHYEIVYGGTGSIRLFLLKETSGSLDLPAPMHRASAIAEELLRFSKQEARYPEDPGHGRDKGWIIRSVKINGSPAAVAEAAWV